MLRAHAETLANAGVRPDWTLVGVSEGRALAYADLLHRYQRRYEQLKLSQATAVADAHDILNAVLSSDCDVDLLLIDEGQDLTPLQLRACCHLARHGELVLTGDAAQSIYGFRHADPTGLLDLPAGPPLQRNRRSSRAIVTLANALPIPERLAQSFHTTEDGSVRYGVVQTEDDGALARAVAVLVSGEQAQPCPPATTAVLCRDNRQVRRVVSACRAASLPVRWNAHRFLARSQAVRAVVSYTQHLLGTQLDEPDVRLVLEWLAGATDGWLDSLAAEGGLEPALRAAARSRAIDCRFRRGHDALSAMSPGVPLRRRLRAVVEHLDLLARLRRSHPDGIEADALLALLEVVEQESDYLTVDELRELVLAGDAGGPETDPGWRQQGITVLTVHDAKGLEWDSALLVFFESSPTRSPGPALVEPQSDTTVRIGIRDVRLDSDSRRILSPSGYMSATAQHALLTRLPDSVYSQVSARRQREERSEDLRVDYVAVTRARQRLTFVVGSADGKWPLPLKHLYDAIAHTRAVHPHAALPIAGPVTASIPKGQPATNASGGARTTIERPRPLTPLPISPTQLERLIDAD